MIYFKLQDNFFPQFESRRRSLNESPDLEHSQRRSQFGSTPDLNHLGRISEFTSMSHGQSTDSISLKEETLSCHDDIVCIEQHPSKAYLLGGVYSGLVIKQSRLSCSKLAMWLVKVSLKIQMAILQIHCYFFVAALHYYFLLKKSENRLHFKVFSHFFNKK